ncbi:MAG: autoinducer-2 kinase, partial [Christensenellales bacterium]
MAKTLMAVDAGTGSVRAVLFSLEGEQLGCVQQEWTHKEDPRYPGSMDFDWVHNW